MLNRHAERQIKLGAQAQLNDYSTCVTGFPPQKYRTFVRYFLCGIGDSPRFHRGVALQHEPLRADAYAITEASKTRFLRIPLSPPQKYRTFVRYFLYKDICRNTKSSLNLSIIKSPDNRQDSLVSGL